MKGDDDPPQAQEEPGALNRGGSFQVGRTLRNRDGDRAGWDYRVARGESDDEDSDGPYTACVAGRFHTSMIPTPRTAAGVTNANTASASTQALPGLSRATDLPRTRPIAVSSVAARAAGTTLFSTPAPIQSPTCPNPFPRSALQARPTMGSTEAPAADQQANVANQRKRPSLSAGRSSLRRPSTANERRAPMRRSTASSASATAIKGIASTAASPGKKSMAPRREKTAAGYARMRRNMGMPNSDSESAKTSSAPRAAAGHAH